MQSQQAMAKRLLSELGADFDLDEELGTDALLDIMGVCGFALVEGTAASEAFMASAREAAAKMPGSAVEPVPPNPDEHPAESARSDGPATSLQSVIDVHLDAIVAQFAERGLQPMVVGITARFPESVDTAGNDTVSGWAVADGLDEGEAILSFVNRLMRSVRRVYAPELR